MQNDLTNDSTWTCDRCYKDLNDLAEEMGKTWIIHTGKHDEELNVPVVAIVCPSCYENWIGKCA